MRVLRVLIATVLTSATYGATVAGTLLGTVVDGSGAPIAGAFVIYRAVPTLKQASVGSPILRSVSVASGIKTAADGTFSVGDLPSGNYQLCAYGTNSADLGSCEWGQGTTQVAVTSGQAVSLALQIAQGTILTFQVQDLAQKVISLEDLPVVSGRIPLAGANFGIGIWADSRYLRATLVSKTATTRQYQVAISKTASVRLYLDTSLTVLDVSGTSIPTRQLATTISPAGQGGVTINIIVP